MYTLFFQYWFIDIDYLLLRTSSCHPTVTTASPWDVPGMQDPSCPTGHIQGEALWHFSLQSSYGVVPGANSPIHGPCSQITGCSRESVCGSCLPRGEPIPAHTGLLPGHQFLNGPWPSG